MHQLSGRNQLLCRASLILALFAVCAPNLFPAASEKPGPKKVAAAMRSLAASVRSADNDVTLKGFSLTPSEREELAKLIESEWTKTAFVPEEVKTEETKPENRPALAPDAAINLVPRDKPGQPDLIAQLLLFSDIITVSMDEGDHAGGYHVTGAPVETTRTWIKSTVRIRDK